jgi:DNA-binding response OmpR family regulator
LFQAFSQIDSSLARKFEGTGLGLAMVKQMAQLHGGAVAVASAVGEGARFALWLPLRAAGDAMARAAAEPVAAQRHALVIESAEPAADLLPLLLEAEGFAVLRVCSAAAALRVVQQQALSLITLDLDLPDIAGLLPQLRENIALASVPVMAMTCSACRESAIPAGAATVLQKPVSRAELKIALHQMDLDADRKRAPTVLIVDDDPKAVEVIAAFLAAPAYAVVRAYGGLDAIAAARRLRPDLILLDLVMPEISGFDVIDALARDAGTASIAIIVVTSRQVTAQDRSALNAHHNGTVQVLEKSEFNQARFSAEVRRALASSPSPSRSC